MQAFYIKSGNPQNALDKPILKIKSPVAQKLSCLGRVKSPRFDKKAQKPYNCDTIYKLATMPNENENKTPPTVENVIKTYSLIHRYFFTYAIFVVVLIIGALSFQSILRTNALTAQTNQVNHEFIIRQKEIIGAFNNQLKQNVENQGVTVQIIQ